MVIGALQLRPAAIAQPEARLGTLVAYLRAAVLPSAIRHERCHAVFVDPQRRFLGDTSVGLGNFSALSLRMRDVFAEALRLGASGMILAHNHPSGECRPSDNDIAATRRLAEVALALDVALIDHLIFTHKAVYSMRAGGLL
ncbi:MAG: hypothetical protein RIT17_752 [Pseudomonadota bacterium]|jgi:DNA repair protein RadC